MPYLPAKDELLSLNRLSSRGHWKWSYSKVFDRRLGRGAAFHRFSRKRKFFGNCDCDFRKCFTRYEEFRNFCFDGKFSIFKTAALKLAALIWRCKSVESGCMMWKTLPINLFWWGSQLLGTTWSAATWQRGCFSETADWIKD